MSVTVEKVPMQHSPVTTSTYKCSDEACQESSEREMARFIKKKADQDAAKEDRMQKARQAKKDMAQKA